MIFHVLETMYEAKINKAAPESKEAQGRAHGRGFPSIGNGEPNHLPDPELACEPKSQCRNRNGKDLRASSAPPMSGGGRRKISVCPSRPHAKTAETRLWRRHCAYIFSRVQLKRRRAELKLARLMTSGAYINCSDIGGASPKLASRNCHHKYKS